MKTKLSFLALPFCLGLVLTFVIAACSSGGGSGPEPGKSSGSTGGPSLNLSSEQSGEKIDFSDDFEVYVSNELVLMKGTIDATSKEPIVRLEFITQNGSSQPGWVKYKDDPVTGPLTVSTPFVKLNDVEIDLNNESISCGSHSITIKACTDPNCPAGKVASRNGSFVKPEQMCVSSSSAGAPSSSSEAVWVFGAPQSGDANYNSSITVGSGSVKLIGADEHDTQPDVEVSGGKIRRVDAVEDDDIVPGKPYSSKKGAFGSDPATSSNLQDEGLQQDDYYLIYLSGGDVYLIQFSKKTIWPEYPKTYTIWRATEHP